MHAGAAAWLAGVSLGAVTPSWTRAVSTALEHTTYADKKKIKITLSQYPSPHPESSSVLQHLRPSLINQIVITILVTFSFPKEWAGKFHISRAPRGVSPSSIATSPSWVSRRGAGHPGSHLRCWPTPIPPAPLPRTPVGPAAGRGANCSHRGCGAPT